MIRLWSFRLAAAGALVLACSRDRAKEAALPDTVGAIPGAAAADTSMPAVRPGAPARSGADTSGAAAPSSTQGNRAPAGTPRPDTPPAAPVQPKPNIDPQRPGEPPRVPKPAAVPEPAQDTAPRAVTPTPLRDPYHQAPKDTVSPTVYEGWKQYNLNCARCHGEDVLGTTIAPHLLASLKPSGPINTKALFVNVVCHGRPEKGMPAWCPLGFDTAKIERVYAYVKGRSDGKIGPGRPARRE